MTPTVQTLALEFSQGLHAHLTPKQMRKVVERNRAETASNVCHSHDFCDANMVLHGVFLRHGMDPASEGGMERHGLLWDQVWNLAKSREFRLDEEGAEQDPAAIKTASPRSRMNHMNLIDDINRQLTVKKLQPLTKEQLQCLRDRARLDEAAAMLEDLRARYGVQLLLPEGERMGPFADEDEADEHAEEQAQKFDAVSVDALATDEGRSYGRNQYYVIGFNGPNAGLAAACKSWSGVYWFRGQRRGATEA